MGSPPRIALWGAGMISAAHGAAAGYLGFPISAVASRSVERAASQAQRFQTAAVAYDDLPGDADIVVVSTPPQLHAADALRLLEAGTAVILEKPLCTTLADADRLVYAAAVHNQRILYAENLAYAPVIVDVLAMAGSIGPVEQLEVRTLQALPTWGDFTSDAWGGGALFDLGVHPLAVAVLAARAAGAGDATSVSAVLRGGDGHGTDEHAEVALTFGGGLEGSIVSSWHFGPGQVWDVQLSSATAVLRADLWPRPTIERDGALVPHTLSSLPIPSVEELGYYGQLRAFADDLAHDRTPFMNVEFGRLILEIVCAAYQSASRGGAPEAVPFTGDRTKTPLELWRQRRVSSARDGGTG